MKNNARIQVETIVSKHQQRHNLKPKSIRIKSQKIRWGSCDTGNNINTNWLLILASPEFLEYVVVHELCHIRHRNHCAKFWALVLAHLPDYKRHNLWLRGNGGALMEGL